MFAIKGFAFVKYYKLYDAMRACDQSSGTVMDRRTLRINYAQSRGDKEQILQPKTNE